MSDPTRWLELSLEVDGELAEAVAEVLARFAPNRVAIEASHIQDQPDGEGVPTGPVRVAAYLPVDEDLEATRQRIEEALWHLHVIRPLPQPTYRFLQEQDWAEAWKHAYRPIAVGERLMIVPAWLENPDPQRVPLLLDPGMAFGTGTHPTTQMCLAEVERLVQPGMTVLDVGCGSGILSIAALKLGAVRALGVDTDPQAVAVAQENAARNGVAEGFRAAVGSVEALRQPPLGPVKAPLVLANILAPILVRLLDEEGLADLLTPDGALVLSGILENQAEDVLAAARRAGLALAHRRQMDDWVTLTVKPM
ncbi:MAG: 50S ribosomal protein L11 methyltransferase [Chloroflexi bacterium]|nr:50S ribosomal protein L11 methyltransferase [Chloroflexota bacterium]